LPCCPITLAWYLCLTLCLLPAAVRTPRPIFCTHACTLLLPAARHGSLTPAYCLPITTSACRAACRPIRTAISVFSPAVYACGLACLYSRLCLVLLRYTPAFWRLPHLSPAPLPCTPAHACSRLLFCLPCLIAAALAWTVRAAFIAFCTRLVGCVSSASLPCLTLFLLLPIPSCVLAAVYLPRHRRGSCWLVLHGSFLTTAALPGSAPPLVACRHSNAHAALFLLYRLPRLPFCTCCTVNLHALHACTSRLPACCLRLFRFAACCHSPLLILLALLSPFTGLPHAAYPLAGSFHHCIAALPCLRLVAAHYLPAPLYAFLGFLPCGSAPLYCTAFRLLLPSAARVTLRLPLTPFLALYLPASPAALAWFFYFYCGPYHGSAWFLPHLPSQPGSASGSPRFCYLLHTCLLVRLAYHLSCRLTGSAICLVRLGFAALPSSPLPLVPRATRFLYLPASALVHLTLPAY